MYFDKVMHDLNYMEVNTADVKVNLGRFRIE